MLGFTLSEHHDAELAYGALAMAVVVRGGHVPGVIMQTDHGSEYTARLFRAACKRLSISQSMGRPGSALDKEWLLSLHLLVLLRCEIPASTAGMVAQLLSTEVRANEAQQVRRRLLVSRLPCSET